MALTINTNIPSLRSDREIQKKSNDLKTSMEQLASGKRINRASDDPAGLAVAMSLLTNVSVSDVAQRNVNDAISAANIADGAISTASDIASRLGELAQQASNGTLSAEQRTALNNEYTALRSELDRISQTTEFNGQQLLSGESNYSVQAGTTGGSNSQVGIPLPGVSSASLGLSSTLSSQSGALTALSEAKAAVGRLAEARGNIGASVSRLEVANENLRAASVNEQDAASQIFDADIAEQSANSVASRIQQQAAVAVKAQANILPQLALKLLQ
jgi:flagellin